METIKNFYQSEAYLNSKDKKVTIYQDPKIRIYQFGKGYTPFYFMWCEDLDTHQVRKIIGNKERRWSTKFSELIDNYFYHGNFEVTYKDTPDLIPNVDFTMV